MSFCQKCGYELKWRTIGGKRTPMGCRCDYGEYGLSQFYRDSAAPATCPKCGEDVFFVRHNGGSVWFDGLGDPWLKHPCFDVPETAGRLDDTPKPKEAYPTGPMRQPGAGSGTGDLVFILKLGEADLGQRFIYVSLDSHAVPILPEASFWFHRPTPAVGQRILLDLKKSTIELFPGKAEYRYLKIDLNRCVDCGSHYLNHEGHLDICSGKSKNTD
jgi:hypothetical protein